MEPETGDFAGIALSFDWGWGWTLPDDEGVKWFRVGPVMFGWFA